MGNIQYSPGLNYLDVTLAQGERWIYNPPQFHNVAFIVMYKGSGLQVCDYKDILINELIVFNESDDAILFTTTGEEVKFILESAVKHPHDLILGRYSVHTSANALRMGESRIAELGKDLKLKGFI